MSGEYHRVSAGGTTEWDPPPPYSVPGSGEEVVPAVLGARSPFDDPEGDEDEDMGGGVVDGFAPHRHHSGRSAEFRNQDQRPVSYLDAESLDQRSDDGDGGGGGEEARDPFMDPAVSPTASSQDLRGYGR